MMSVVREAFRQVHDGYSVDRIICDPDLNSQFTSKCHALGLSDDVSQLNRSLLSLRKSGRLALPTTKQTRFDDEEYRFAAEIAARHIERRDSVSLDEILVDSVRAGEFDGLCSDLCPSATPLQYRWSALGLRKQRGLTPEIISHAIPAMAVTIHGCKSLSIDHIPIGPGLYIFFDDTQTLYVGEASNLRARLKKHLDHSDNKQLAQWFWKQGFEKARIELHLLDKKCSTRVRRSLETELIRSRKPAFNIRGINSVSED